MNREAERKRLVEILKQNCHCINEDCEKCSSNGICFTHREVDHLLDNGIGVKPHCEAGEIVYLAIESPKPQIKPKIIESIVIGILDDKIVFTDGTCFTIWHKDWDLYNNAVFTSREDAVKALEGSGEKWKN